MTEESVLEVEGEVLATESVDNLGIIIGGVSLLKNDKFVMSAGPAVVYRDLEYKQVQLIWRALAASPALVAALKMVNDAAGPILTRLGDEYGVATGKMTLDDLALINSLLQDD